MKERLYRRCLVCIIIIFFVGASALPSISGDIVYTSKQQFEDDHPELLFNNQGLIAYWKFDECTGNTLIDLSGHGYNGTIYGATWSGGYTGCALNFDGLDDYVDFDSHSENLGFNKTDDYVISAYISTTTDNTGTIYAMSYPDGITVYAFLEINPDGSILFRTGTSGCILSVISQGGYNDGDWHLIEVKFYGSDDNPTLELYVDSELEDSVTEWLCPITNSDFKTAKMGRSSNNETNYFNGKIDEVKIFKYPEFVNQPPSAPNIDGPTSGKTGTKYDYTFTSIDPNGDQISYYIDWDDGTIEDWFGPFDSGDPQTVSHTWNEDGTYTISARAKDTHGAQSVWGTLIVTMPRNKVDFHSFLLKFLERFPIIQQLLGV